MFDKNSKHSFFVLKVHKKGGKGTLFAMEFNSNEMNSISCGDIFNLMSFS